MQSEMQSAVGLVVPVPRWPGGTSGGSDVVVPDPARITTLHQRDMYEGICEGPTKAPPPSSPVGGSGIKHKGLVLGSPVPSP